MRISVELEQGLVDKIIKLTGEKKKSAAIAKAAELFANRSQALALLRSFREDPLDYPVTNEELEALADPIALTQKVDYRKNSRKRS
jgi:hypothetical protein